MILNNNAISEAGASYVLASISEGPIPPNGFSYPGMRAAITAYLKRAGFSIEVVDQQINDGKVMFDKPQQREVGPWEEYKDDDLSENDLEEKYCVERITIEGL